MENFENSNLSNPKDLNSSPLTLSTVKADEEDLTVINDSGTDVLKFKDRIFNPIQFSNLGHKNLRQRLVDGKNLLQQQDFLANTIHEIRHDFDLNGSTITLPENVVLKFCGGSLKNGTIIGNGTKIDAGLVKIFGIDITFSGSFSIAEVYLAWFGPDVYSYTPVDVDLSLAVNHPNITNLQDSSDHFKKAFELSVNAACYVKTQGVVYKVAREVNMLKRGGMFLDSKTIIHLYMQGQGNIICTQDYDTFSITKQTMTEPVLALRPNQYFDTSCMAIGFRIYPNEGFIKGKGCISAINSTYAIALLGMGEGYNVLDMQFGSPNLDLRLVGGKDSTIAPDVKDLFGNGDPIGSMGVNGDHYFDKTTKTYWVKTDNAWGRPAGYPYDANSRYNTCLRLECFWNDQRIINPQIELWAMYGFRGVEYIATGGGWINDSIWKGTISNFHGNFLSIFTEYSIAGHDMSNVSMQVDYTMGDDSRLIQIIKGHIVPPKTWDLSWLGIQRGGTEKYYLGKGTRNIPLVADGIEFITDEGTTNLLNTHKPWQGSQSDVVPLTYSNILKYRTPDKLGFYNDIISSCRVFSTILSPAIMASNSLGNDGTGLGTAISYPNMLFDESPNSYFRCVDTANNIMGTAIPLRRNDDGNILISRFNNMFVVVEYILNRAFYNSTDAGSMFVSFCGGNGKVYRTVRLFKGTNHVGRWKSTLIIKSDNLRDRFAEYGPNAFLGLVFHTDKSNLIQTLDVVNIKMYTDADWGDNINNESGPTLNRPNACPKGHIYEDTSLGKTLVNKGDSMVQKWAELPLEDIGSWTVSPGTSISAATADYSKIGQQVFLAGQLSFSNSYLVNTDIPIQLPFVPHYGGVFTVGDLTFTLSNNNLLAQVKSASTGNHKPFQLNYKTV